MSLASLIHDVINRRRKGGRRKEEKEGGEKKQEVLMLEEMLHNTPPHVREQVNPHELKADWSREDLDPRY